MKSIILRVIPSWILVLVVRQIVDVDYDVFVWIDTIALAFVWGGIHKFLGKPSSMTVIEWSLGVAIAGCAITFISSLQIEVKIIMIGLSVYLGATSLMKFNENEIKKKDNRRAKKFLLRNVYEIRRLFKLTNSIYKITQSGSKSLNKPLNNVYIADGPAFEPAWRKLIDMGYTLYTFGPQLFLLLGRDGLAVIKLLTEKGNYEFKKGKWYKDGKKCNEVSKEINLFLRLLSKERGNNSGIIVKTFEEGSVNGVDCKCYITDVTKGYDEFINIVEKITRVENYENKLNKKADRVYWALGIE